MMQQPLKVLTGVTDELELYADRLEIRSRHNAHAVRTLKYPDIAGIFLTEGTFFINGYLKLTLSDDHEVVFVYDHRFNERAREMREMLLDKIGHRDILPFIHRA